MATAVGVDDRTLPVPSVAHASRSIRLASSAFGLVPIVQATGIPVVAVDHRG
ncbi:hypothetical protein BIGA_1791 [Bifidobacterium pullorum subsp. gallinarum]|uniref:Uncharacterized protein n=1 Tax=Bifidobacterium pullorum subsp. gallinarum TaxID=78344 RepID=A0A087AL07_9BIFI|nr:hypothetical protein BIGA_1791 [Bifidobacterium pullorum subsp. gallinarum]